MLKDITLGQYYPGDSVIHKMDPRVKLLVTIIYIVELFLIRNVYGLILMTALLIIVTGVSRVPFKLMLKGIRGIWVLIVITVICNLLFMQGEVIYFEWNFIHITDLGIHNAVYYTLRLIYLVAGTSLMTLTTTPSQLTVGMETGLRPLSKVGIPVHEIAMMMSIALRFIPILSEEADKIKKAQMARGAKFDEGNIIEKAKSLIPILVPLFVSAFRIANDLAMAMEARCYHGGEGRTRMKPLHYEKRDYVAYVLTALSVVAVILLRIFTKSML